EIERKFLVDIEKWDIFIKPDPIIIRQGYLSTDDLTTIRVRTKNDKGYLTVKGKTIGITREEFEYEIPFNDAVEMLEKFASPYLHKIRYEIMFGSKIWEIDVFQGKLAPLIIAEIELTNEDETFTKPDFISEEVSHLPEYFNSNIIKRLVE